MEKKTIQHGSRSRTAEENSIATLMDRFVKAFIARDVTLVMSCVTDDFVWHLPEGRGQNRGTSVQGRQDVRDFLTERFRQTDHIEFSEIQDEIFGQTVMQRYRVASRPGINPKIDAFGLDVYRIRDNLIASKDAYWKAVEWPLVK